MKAVSLAIQIILYVALGYLIERLHLVDKQFSKSLSRMLMNVTLPCTIVNSLLVPFAPEELKSCGILVVLALGWSVLCFVLGHIFYILTGKTKSGRIFRFGGIFTNFTFMGMTVAETLFGAQGLFLYVVFTLPIRILFYPSAKPMLAPAGADQHMDAKTIAGFVITPPVIAVFVGLILYLTQLPLPQVLSGFISSVGAISSPMGMILCGLTLAKYPVRQVAKPRYLLLPFYRNLILPAVAVGLALLLKLEPMVARVVVIFAACPVASLLTTFTIQYVGDPDMELDAAGSVFLSTAFSALTIPFWSWVLEQIYGAVIL